MFVNKIFSILYVISMIGFIDSAKILGVFTSFSKSHFIVQESLMRQLAIRGHEVTLYTFYNQSDADKLPNYRWITIEETAEFDLLKNYALQDASDNGTSIFQKIPMFLSILSRISTHVINHPKMLELKKESFDLFVLGIFGNDHFLGLAAHFQCPSILVSATPGFKMIKDYVSSEGAFSTEPFPVLGYTEPMNFCQRFINFLVKSFEHLAVNLINYFIFEPAYRENFPPAKYPSFDEVRKNVSLVIVSDHFSQSVAKANVPAFIEAAGMHISSEPNPLPKDIQEFLDSATDGAIFFSFGSNIKSSNIPTEKRHVILSALSKLKQKVLWKFEDEHLPNKPENVMIGKWLPQADILAHQNVKLFISHCGKGSVNEAKYHGVPILGIPMFAEQPANLKIIIEEGWALPLDYATLTEQSIIDGVNELIANPKYSKIVRTSSELFKDRPLTPMAEAIFWVEYVLRHNGAKHTQSNGVHLNFFQYHSLDVLGFILLILVISYKIFKFIVKTICKKYLIKLKKD